ncbi:hypothetical protein Tco_0739643 [Tanacetum coccineum]
MKVVRCSSHISIVPSLSSSSQVFASLVVTFNSKFLQFSRKWLIRGTGESERQLGRQPPTMGSIHPWDRRFQRISRKCNVIDVRELADRTIPRVLRWIVSLFEWNSSVSSMKSSIQSTFRFR